MARPRASAFIEEDEYVLRLVGQAKARRQVRTRKNRRKPFALPPVPEPIQREGGQILTSLEKTAGGAIAGLASAGLVEGPSLRADNDHDIAAAALWSGFPILGPPSYYLATGEIPIPTTWKGFYYCLLAGGVYGTIEGLAMTMTFGTQWTSRAWIIRNFHPARFYLRKRMAFAIPGVAVASRWLWQLAAVALVDDIWYRLSGEHIWETTARTKAEGRRQFRSEVKGGARRAWDHFTRPELPI